MGRGGYRGGVHHLPVEACHSLTAWGYFIWAQMWHSDETFKIEWEFVEDRAGQDHPNCCQLRFVRQGINREQRVFMEPTACNYGKSRGWFVCPNCERRVGKVYLPEPLLAGGRQLWKFLCRHCYQLTYLQRQKRDQYWPLKYRAERLAERWLGELSDGWIGKQKGQHQTTFDKRADEYEALKDATGAYFMRGFTKIKLGRDLMRQAGLREE